jgi:hypothetical protein
MKGFTVVLLVASLVATAGAASCKWSASGITASYDLSPLMRTGVTPFEVTDGDIPCTPAVEANYTYIFDICENVESAKMSARATTACAGKEGVALQFDPDPTKSDNCQVVAQLGDKTDGWDVIDPANPAVGVQIQYSNGDKCHHDAEGHEVPGGIPRSILVKIPCDSSRTAAIPESAAEPSHCQYEVTIPSMYGCPTQCPISGRKVCGGHGLCDYDTTHKKVHCFCDDGYTGAACNTKGDSSDSGTSGTVIALLVVLLIMTLGLSAVVVLMVKMLRAYRQDASNYLAIHGQSGFDDHTDV